MLMSHEKDVKNKNTPNNKFHSILIFGPPGSGKGTMSRFLCSNDHLYHLSSGDIFRRLSSDTPNGRIFHQYASKGLLLPDEVTVQIWQSYLAELVVTNQLFPAQQYLLLDGIPRTVKQAQLMEPYIDLKHIIVLDVTNSNELVQRIQKRAKIERRTDDIDINVLNTRMKVYQEETTKLLDHYPANLITHFSAEQPPFAVLRDILEKLADLLSEQITTKSHQT